MTKPIVVGTPTFRDLIEGGFLYVDKTEAIYPLIRYPKGIYFLARPRRFGKSLTVSTLKEIFIGNKELFRGLWLYQSDYNWQAYPVLRFDFSKERVDSAERMIDTLKSYLEDIAYEYDISLQEGPPERQFRWLIQQLARAHQGKVVILIDEYDKPLIDNLNAIPVATEVREILRAFYGVIKAMDEHIRFVFITGISKFSRVGIFSQMNHLDDLTMNPEFAELVGITAEELHREFADYIDELAKRENLSIDALTPKIQQWYNGFCFAAGAQRLYNPFSLLSLFKQKRFSNYWFETGTPTFLVNLIRERHYPIQEFEGVKLPATAFSTFELDKLEIVPVMFQTGYLTIKEYEPATQRYTLAYPNDEVEDSFVTYLLSSFAHLDLKFSEEYLWRLIDALAIKDFKRFFTVVDTFFAQIPYDLHVDHEKYYQTVIYLIFLLMGFRIEAEVKTNQGRIDVVAELDSYIALFEFKLDGDEEAALQQIKTKEYFQKYWLKGKPIILFGVNFDGKHGKVAGWKTETQEVTG